jgi:Flp pilus assembly protein TadG
MKFNCHRSAKRRGVSAVEGAIVLSVTVLFIFGGLDVGLLVTRYNALGEAACRAARAVAVRGSSADQLGTLGPTAMEFTADANNVVADSFRFLLPTMNPAEVSARIEWPDGTNTPDSRVRVTLQYQHHCHVPALLGYGNFLLQSTSVMAVAH